MCVSVQSGQSFPTTRVVDIHRFIIHSYVVEYRRRSFWGLRAAQHASTLGVCARPSIHTTSLYRRATGRKKIENTRIIMNLEVSIWFVLYKKKQTVGCCARA